MRAPVCAHARCPPRLDHDVLAMSLSSCCLSCSRQSKFDSEDERQTRASRAIDAQIERDKRVLRKEVKLLLLGAGESGKSTFLKQMRLIHGQSLLDAEHTLDAYRRLVYENVLKGMQVLVDARRKLQIAWGADLSAAFAARLFACDNCAALSPALFAPYAEAVSELWRDRGIREAFERRVEFQLSDGVRFLFEQIARIAAADYEPTNADILHARKATKGVTEYSVTLNSVPFRFVDVGGQRSQRHKWFQCFDSVTSVVFMVSSSEFDQVLLEDRETNRLLESTRIFDTIANSRAFADVSFIVLLNKSDLLAEKLSTASAATIDRFFPEFVGDPRHLRSVQLFELDLFDRVRRDRRRPMYHHFTTAVDTENIKYVFGAVRNTILQKNITQLMLQ